MDEFLNTLGNGGIVLSLAMILFAGFFITRITKLMHLPNVTGYIFAGILIGPNVLHLIPVELIHSMDFVTDTALAFIAFGVGKYFRLEVLKKQGKMVVIVTVFESLIAGCFITVAMMFFFHLSLSFSLLLGAIGCATAPASTIMTIRQYHAKGPFVDLILQVTALDDAVALFAFTISTALVQSMKMDGFSISSFLLPLCYHIAVLGLGGLAGWILHFVLRDQQNLDHRLSFVVAMIFMLTGVCLTLNISPLLSCMLMGCVYVNVAKNSEIFHQVNAFTPPLLLVFFVLSGMRLNIASLGAAGVIGICYFLVRILGKYVGAYMGCNLANLSKDTQHYLGYALIPQAGVSIGLAALGMRILPETQGILLSTIILSSAVLYETIGPACAKFALYKTKAIPTSKNVECKAVSSSLSHASLQ